MLIVLLSKRYSFLTPSPEPRLLICCTGRPEAVYSKLVSVALSADSGKTTPSPTSGCIVTRSSPDRSLADLADLVAEHFSDYRQPEDFNELSLVIDNSDPERSTLIVHIDHEQPADLAERVETFLHDNGARTQRERHSETDIRVLATLE